MCLENDQNLFMKSLSNDLENYDLKSYSADKTIDKKDSGHFPDTYKKPNHPSFSEDSKYHNTNDIIW